MKKRSERPAYAELRDLGVMSKSHANELASGKKRPSLELARKIELATGYPATAWLEEKSA